MKVTAKRWAYGVPMRPYAGAVVVTLTLLILFGMGSRARADSLAIDFENPPYMTGSINGQDGWSQTNPAYDVKVAATAGFGSPTGFGAQSFRISNAVTSGSFGDWAFSKSLNDEAGEPTADNGGFSGGTRQPHFEVSFDIVSAVPGSEQPGLQMSVAPDRGDGARMSFLRFRDTPTGLAIDFADYQDVAPFGTPQDLSDGCGAGDGFVVTTIASGLDRSVPHHIKLTVEFVPGPRNDVVRVFVDGALVSPPCSTTWEDYYRYCTESQPPVDVSRTVDSLLLQARGNGTTDNKPANLGKGFLVDNLNLLSGPVITPFTPCDQPPLDHFVCHEVHQPTLNKSVSLEDQFGASTVRVVKAKRLCAPADKNGEDPTAPQHTNHLTEYQIQQTSPKFLKIRGQMVFNQFHATPASVDLLRPDFMMVPTAKDAQSSPPLLPAPTIDHFKCYKVRGPKSQNRTVTVITQFGTRNIVVKRLKRLCAPANKNNENPTAPDHLEHLACYTVRDGGPPTVGPTTFFVNNQFGPATFEIFGARELCVPSNKNVPPTTSSTSTSTSTSTTSTSSTTTTLSASPSFAFDSELYFGHGLF